MLPVLMTKWELLSSSLNSQSCYTSGLKQAPRLHTRALSGLLKMPGLTRADPGPMNMLEHD